MLTRRGLLILVPPSLVAVATPACSGSGEKTPSDAETGADTGPGDSGGPDTAAPDDTAPSDACPSTDDNIEGPFYRSDAPERDDLVTGSDEGTELLLSGRVLHAEDCTPAAGAVVDLWHADPDGAYDNDSAEMRYRGRVRADADGRWSIRTLEPGHYLNGSQYRPAHLHVKIWVDGVERLTTQLYFPDDPYNDADPWYLPALEIVRTGDGTATFDFAV